MGNSILATDGYKFSMAAAGFPLRRETFYYSHRKGGPHYLPFDVEETIRAMLPEPFDYQGDGPHDDHFLIRHGYDMGGAFWKAMQGEIEIKALPKGTWFFDREPVFTVTGPSALVSWLEPLVLQLHWRIQLATLAKLGKLPETIKVTCEEQEIIGQTTLMSIGEANNVSFEVRPDDYRNHVQERVSGLLEIVEDRSRIFEVGMRAATCMGQHRIALKAAREVGLRATSNVLIARELLMKAVGTMGHEHVQRFGNDEDAFRAMRDRHPGPTSFLLDTFSTIHSGLPTAFKLIAEDPSRNDTVRFDSGDKRTQFLIACSMAKSMGIKPRFILEDGFNAEMTREFEELRVQMDIPAEDVLYGYGGYIVKAPDDPLTRDRVAAVWKVTQSGPKATMKFGDEPGSGKESIPGKPVLYRHFVGGEWLGTVYQEGEKAPHDDVPMMRKGIPPRHIRFTPGEALKFQKSQGARPAYSPETQRLVRELTAARQAAIKGA